MIPWEDVLIGTFVLDPKGRGMHKSKGNAIWCHELLDKFNVDVVRYWVGTANFGDDLPFKEKELTAGQKFQIKLWNATKFAIMHLKDYDNRKPKKLELYDKAVLSKLNRIISQAKELMEAYKISDVKRLVENFFWHDFCDNYLEIAKDRLYNPDKRGEESRLSAQYTLYHSLLTILKLMAPIMPFITEEIYQGFFKEKEKEKSIHISSWPEQDKKLVDEKAESAGEIITEIVAEVRKVKTENNKPLNAPVTNLIIKCEEAMQKDVEAAIEDLKAVTKAEKIEFGKDTKVII
jgi:valyl-tRNA synthetase